MTKLHSLDGGRKRVHSMGVAGLVRGEFGDCPHLADFLEQCFATLDEKRWPRFNAQISATLLTESVLVGVLRYTRVTLTQRFRRLVDVDPMRTRVLFDQFMPFSQQRLDVGLAPGEYAPLRELLAGENAVFRRFLILRQGEVDDRWARNLLVFINSLVWLSVLSSPDDIVLTDDQRLGRLVERLLGIEDEDVDDEPTAPYSAETNRLSKRAPPVPMHYPPPRLTVIK